MKKKLNVNFLTITNMEEDKELIAFFKWMVDHQYLLAAKSNAEMVVQMYKDLKKIKNNDQLIND